MTVRPGLQLCSRRSLGLHLAAMASMFVAVMLTVVSSWLNTDRLTQAEGALWIALAGVLGGALFLCGWAYGRHETISLRQVVLVAAIGRIVVCLSQPCLETDHFRYRWDGAMLASGLNPYSITPEEAVSIRSRSSVQPADPFASESQVSTLAHRAGAILDSINHPHLTTIYPPLAQVAFAAAYLIDPFGIPGLRLLYALADALTLFLLVALLRSLGVPLASVILYAWNPILLREVYSALHMDILVLPLVVLGLLLIRSNRPVLASVAIALGGAVKIWPLILLPLLLRPQIARPTQLIPAVTVALVTTAILWSPMVFLPDSGWDGFLAYGRSWQNNDGLFGFGVWILERGLPLVGSESWHAQTSMRWITASCLLLVLIVISWKIPATHQQLFRKSTILISIVFLLSPTQFPWYFIWCLPLIAIAPWPPIILYSALLPLYLIQDRSPWIIWLEHAPVWILILLVVIRMPGTQHRPSPVASFHA